MQHYPLPLLNTLIFLLTSLSVLFCSRFFKISPTLGYLLAGIVISPKILGLIQDIDGVRLIGELGIVFLLFKVGLELPFHRLQALRTYVFGLGAAQVLFTTFFLSIAFHLLLGFSFEKSLFIGCALAFSSTALVIQLLAEKSELSTKLGRVTFSVLLFQDLFIVVLFVVSTFDAPSGSASSWIPFLLFFLKSLGGLAVLLVGGRFILTPLFQKFFPTNHMELFVVGIFCVLFGFTYLTFCFGIPIELGAFIAGLSLAETTYRHQVEGEIKSLQALFLGFFFIIVGLEIQLDSIFNDFFLVVSALFLIFFIKAAVLLVVNHFFRIPFDVSLRIAFLLAGCGEFIFILFSFPSIQQWVGNEIVQLLFTITAISMMLTPLLSTGAISLVRFLKEKKEMPTLSLSSLAGVANLDNHVVVVGLGRVGQMISGILSQNMVPYVSVDYNIERVSEGRALKLNVVYGDFRNADLFSTLKLDQARLVILTFSQVISSLEVISALQEAYPNLEICARAQDQEHLNHFGQQGVRFALPEVIESGTTLASITLESIGFSFETIQKILRFSRKK